MFKVEAGEQSAAEPKNAISKMRPQNIENGDALLFLAASLRIDFL
jgi:hypothetical protein